MPSNVTKVSGQCLSSNREEVGKKKEREWREAASHPGEKGSDRN
jgi:hypothetical protein